VNEHLLLITKETAYSRRASFSRLKHQIENSYSM